MTCAHCEDLRAENEHLKRELGYSVARADRNKVRLALGLDAAEAAIVWALYTAKGRVLSPWELVDALPTKNEDRDDARLIRAYVCRLRAKIGKACIRTIWGEGYALDEKGLSKVAGVLA